MRNYVIAIWQLISYFVIGMPLRFFFNAKIRYDVKFEKGKRYIIAANHPERIDPFFISYCVPFRDVARMVPIRYITHEIYMKNPFLYPILKIFGCYTTRERKSGSVLDYSKKYLERGETVFIFPSGTLERKKKKKYTARVGVAYLGKHVENTEIIPAKIDYSRKKHKGVTVTFKKSMTVPKTAKDLQKQADKIYKKILE